MIIFKIYQLKIKNNLKGFLSFPIMEIIGNPKKPQIYICNLCHFISSNKKDYTRHLSTRKHCFSHDGNILEMEKNPKLTKYICKCNKTFITNSGLWKHKPKCKSSDTINHHNEIKILTNLVIEVVKQNQELTNKIINISKHEYSVTNINSNNKTFNLNVFLNEECKDAMNIMDFVNSLNIQLSDLETVGKLGFIDGISSIIIKNLNALEINKRPVHCSDLKRETMYVKDDNKWEKDNVEKDKLRKAIKYIAHKNTKLIPEFREKYPDCIYSDSKKSDQYNKLIIEAMGGKGENECEKEDKIIKNIAKEVIINK